MQKNKATQRDAVLQYRGHLYLAADLLPIEDTIELYALTIQQPWLWLILYGPKRIENRTWKPPEKLLGKRLYLHSGKEFDHGGAGRVRQQYPHIRLPDNYDTGALLGSAIVDSVVTASDDPWFDGPYGWVLSDIEVLPSPIPCRGKQRLWRLPLKSEQPAKQLHDDSLLDPQKDKQRPPGL